jgi:hypothetical protein
MFSTNLPPIIKSRIAGFVWDDADLILQHFSHFIFPALNGTEIAILKIYFCKTREIVLDIPCINLIIVAEL